jgi:hypothetical protein
MALVASLFDFSPRSIGAFLLLAALAPLALASVFGGGAGQALFIDYMQGAYVESFPLPEDEVSVELWSKLLPVGGCFAPRRCCLAFV